MVLDNLIGMCDDVAAGEASFEEVKFAGELLGNILTHIQEFVCTTNYSHVGYPVEYFNRNSDDSNIAVEAFCNILEELEGYFCE